MLYNNENIRALVESKEQFFTSLQLNQWYQENSDEDGTVLKDIILFEESYCENSGEFVMSDFKLNRLGMRVDPKGWKLTNYRKNPVLLWNHDHDKPSIGKMKNVRVENNKLMGRPEFAPKEMDEFAWSIGEKVEAGYLSSGSVGFKTIRIEIKEPKGKGSNSEVEVISREQELYEYSIVNIPALVSSLVTRNEDTEPLVATRSEEDYMERLFIDNEEKLTIFDKKDDRDISGFKNLFKKTNKRK